MEGLEKGLLPSKSTASPKFSSTGLWENNENDSSEDKMIPKFQNQKKTVTKHFMSSTISAASKAAGPRKKILGERKENSNAQDHKISNLYSKKSPLNSSINHSNEYSSYGIGPSYDHYASGLEDDGGTMFLTDSSVNAYDPLKNFLSPRPKYLRFNPNRRREIFNRLEREELNSFFDYDEDDDEESSAEEIEDSCCSPPKEVIEKSMNREISEEDDNAIDDYEVEEERGWCLRGVLKLLLILAACLFSTLYICSMDSPTSSPTQQAIWNLRDGCFMINNHTLELISTKMHHSGFFEVEGNSGRIEERVETKIVENLEGHEMELAVRNENEGNNEDDTNKAVEGEFVVKAHNFEQLVIDAKTDEIIDVGSDSLEHEEVESSFMGSNEDHVNKNEIAESEIIRGGELESETHRFVRLIGAKPDESEDVDGYELAMEIEGSDQLKELELTVEPISEETPNESEERVDETEPLEELSGSHESSVNEVDEIGYVNEVEMQKLGWSLAVIGASLVSIFSVSLAIIHHSRKEGNTPAKRSRPYLKPHKLAVNEKATQVLPSIERKVKFLARPSISSHSMEEAPNTPNHHVHAPTVELISEVIIENSRKKKMTEIEASNATFSTNRESLSPPIEHPTISSSPPSSYGTPSYGSFATERKILKKKGGHQSGEATIGVTPVRRSSRLRNRAAIASP